MYLRLLENSESMVLEIDQVLEELKPLEDNAALNFVNVVEDLLWAFELRATASSVFQLAVKKDIYRQDVFRVADKDWGADFRKLSAGAALVGLTLWLDHMQDASLEGFLLSPKSVVLITGVSEYNVSLNNITERLGLVRPKKFARLALMLDEKRDKAIQADIDGRKQKLEKMKRFGVTKKSRKFVRREAVKGSLTWSGWDLKVKILVMDLLISINLKN
ncbi:hypothetical protein L1987_42973 [Smallanthus sonchifolius]|uniref:Uncharacterized protein n=1 Tax=Smallanthus sonchifolius TaxID=185202 RepID=A0ACB9GK41_9ASTR|nr:hypothetical protein L1987_42973 [Smallanthus sonchifolius]